MTHPRKKKHRMTRRVTHTQVTHPRTEKSCALVLFGVPHTPAVAQKLVRKKPRRNMKRKRQKAENVESGVKMVNTSTSTKSQKKNSKKIEWKKAKLVCNLTKQYLACLA